jgi:hypothetical protein
MALRRIDISKWDNTWLRKVKTMRDEENTNPPAEPIDPAPETTGPSEEEQTDEESEEDAE